MLIEFVIHSQEKRSKETTTFLFEVINTTFPVKVHLVAIFAKKGMNFEDFDERPNVQYMLAVQSLASWSI